ncbi:hypothetical protein T05_6506 [Trichinella murrelli]|uniref:Uncharacterized protein n=1 Tax=Trichinella murrelli TaxID=144512 RepID=A0A0V0U5T6_9BILA|nr:hypothetical protein T05_6506 [Trichinella murrelli]
MLETQFYCFTTSAYYRDCNPLLWFIIHKDVARPYHPSLREAENQCPSLKPMCKAMAEMRIEFLGTASCEAAIKVTDVISAPSSQCVNLAASFIKGYESKLEEKDKVLEIKIDGGFSESIGYYQMHEQFKTSFVECGYRIDKTYETFYKKCPKNSNYETSAEINDRLMETVKSIRTKYADSTSRTVAIFVDATLQSALEFLITEPPTTLEIHILKALHAKMSENYFQMFDSIVYCWDSVQLMCFVYVKDVDIPPRYVGKVGRQSQGSSGPIMTGIESSSVLMGAEIVDMPYNVTNVISAPNFKCLAAAAAFISGYQGPVKVGQNALNIKIDGGLSLTNAAFEMHEKFQSLVAESGYNIDKTYKKAGYGSEQAWRNATATLLTLWYSIGILRKCCEDDNPNLCVDAKSDQENVWNSSSLAMAERKSYAMGRAARYAQYHITDVICAPSFKCVNVADNFIRGFECGNKDEMKKLKIKINGGLSSTVECYYLYKEFRSLAVERGYRVDATYEGSVEWPGDKIIDPYVNLLWRINAIVQSLMMEYTGIREQMVAVFVDKSVESVLTRVTVGPPLPFIMHVPPIPEDLKVMLKSKYSTILLLLADNLSGSNS